MANNKFKAAVKKAKGLYKTGRYKTFAAAVKAAYKKAPAKRKATKKRRRVGAVKFIERGETRRTPAKKVYRIKRSKRGTFKGTSIAGVKAGVEARLGKAMVDHFKCQTIKGTKILDKRISGLKKQLKAL